MWLVKVCKRLRNERARLWGDDFACLRGFEGEPGGQLRDLLKGFGKIETGPFGSCSCCFSGLGDLDLDLDLDIIPFLILVG